MSRMTDYIDDILIESIQKDFGLCYDDAKERLAELRWRIADLCYDVADDIEGFYLPDEIDKAIIDYLSEDYLQYKWCFME